MRHDVSQPEAVAELVERAASLALCDPARGKAMTLEGNNPDDLPTPQTYTHVIAATGGRLIFVAG